MSTSLLASGKVFAAVFNANHELPVIELIKSSVVPLLRKNGERGWFVSSAKLGSAASAIPEVDAGPSSPMVA